MSARHRPLATLALLSLVAASARAQSPLQPQVTGVHLAAPIATVAAGATTTLPIVVDWSDGSHHPALDLVAGAGPNLSQTTSSGTVATGAVTAAGLVVRGWSPGNATITIASGVFQDYARITVTPAVAEPVTGLTFSLTGPIIVNAGQTFQFVAAASNRLGATAPPPLTWSSSDPAVASVSPTGLASAVAVGTTQISATAPNGVAATIIVAVRAPPPAVAAVVITPATVLLGVRQRAKLTATLRDAAGNVITGPTVLWTTSDRNAVNVGADGTITAGAAPGTATIYAGPFNVRVVGSAAVTVSTTP